jgi:hydroxymethylglutaryl-CoA lyase
MHKDCCSGNSINKMMNLYKDIPAYPENGLPRAVRIVEMGPRDGLQNEAQAIDVAVKLGLIERLVQAGLQNIEVTAFVSPRWVPQMADHAQLLARLMTGPQADAARYSVLTPNLQGYEAAKAAGAREVAVFASASEAFSQKNINCSIAQSLQRFAPVLDAAKKDQIAVRAYVSCIAACPYSGHVEPAQVAALAAELFAMGCFEISLGDTIGVGTAGQIKAVIEAVGARVPVEHLAGHFHDTYGQALANVYAAMQCGVSIFDASVSGLGGCPYAAGASGNVATEDLLYLCQGLGLETGLDMEKLIQAGNYINAHLGRDSGSRVALARRRKAC